METTITKSNHATMFQLNFKLSLRGLLENQYSSLINIIGLHVELAGRLLPITIQPKTIKAIKI